MHEPLGNVPLTPREQAILDQLYAQCEAQGIDPMTLSIDSFSFGGVPGRTVVVNSWRGTAEPLPSTAPEEKNQP